MINTCFLSLVELTQSTGAFENIFAVIAFGFVLGIKHALDADHLVAITTIVSETENWKKASKAGLLWGVGHTLALLLLGIVVIAVQNQIPERFALGLEFIVGIMLVYLGIALFIKLFRKEKLHLHEHQHHGYRHVHPHVHMPDEHEPSKWHHSHDRLSRRSLIVGLVHGFAGSAALMLMVLATISSKIWAVVYIAVFGVGSIGGMVLMSALLSIPFMLLNHRIERWYKSIQYVAATLSFVFGLMLMYEIAFVEGLV